MLDFLTNCLCIDRRFAISESYWLFLIFRVLYRILWRGILKDDRSDSESDEESDESSTTPTDSTPTKKDI